MSSATDEDVEHGSPLSHSAQLAQRLIHSAATDSTGKAAPTRATVGVRRGVLCCTIRPLLTPLSLSLALNLLLSLLVLSGCVWLWQSSAETSVFTSAFSVASAASGATQSLIAPYDVTEAVAWRRLLRQPGAGRVDRRQSHTAVCINFNNPPTLTGLAATLTVHTELHRYLTIVSPAPWRDLPVPLPAGVRYIQCVQSSVLLHDDPTLPSHARGYKGVLQHVCAASCFDYYASMLPQVRGVIWQADDMFVNYTALFTLYPHNSSWSPSRSHDALFHLTDEAINASQDRWMTTPVGNLFAARHTAQLLQSHDLYRRAWLLAFGSLDSMAMKAIADFYYLPHYQLQTYVDITRFLRDSADEFVTVPDTANRSLMVSLRVGLTMCEWWTATQMRLTAAIHTLQDEPQANYSSCDLSAHLVHMKSALLYLWGDERDNYTLVHEYCLQTKTRRDSWRKPAVIVHPLKLSVPQHLQIYVDAYDHVLQAWQLWQQTARHKPVLHAAR